MRLPPEKEEREARIYNAKIYKSLSCLLPPDVHTVMNMNSFEDTDVLFYKDNMTAAPHRTVSPADFKAIRIKADSDCFLPSAGQYLIGYLSPKGVAYPFLFRIAPLLKPF